MLENTGSHPIMHFSVIRYLRRLLQLFGFLCPYTKDEPRSIMWYLSVLYKSIITVSCLWPLAITWALLLRNLYLKNHFGEIFINAEMIGWMMWSLVIQISLFRLAWKGKLEKPEPVVKSKNISLVLFMTTLILIMIKTASLCLNFSGLFGNFIKSDVPALPKMINYIFPFCIYHTIPCIVIIYYQCAWFRNMADKFDTFAEKLSSSTTWRTNLKLLEDLYNEYQKLCSSVASFSSDFEVMNSFGIMALFLNASFTGYFILTMPEQTQHYAYYVIQYFAVSLVLIFILLVSFFAAIHHLNKKV